MKNADVEFLLPGTWTFLPIADEDATKRAVARLAEEAFGRADAQARLRAELRAQFADAATRARRTGGEAMWMCRELVPGLPLPATVVLYRPALAIPTAVTREDQLAGLRGLIGPPRPGVVEAELTAGGQTAIRRQTVLTAETPGEGDVPTVDTVECVYWILQPDGRGVLLLVLSCPMPRLQRKLAELFDLIVATMKWRPDAADAPVEPVSA